MELSIVNYYGKQCSKCGYCKGSECSIAYGMHAYNMLPQDYQDLIDRGWRRSGHYCYKPLNENTCCPCYTIKCDTQEFQLSKTHKRILKRMNRFLRDGKNDKNEMFGSTASMANEGKNNGTENDGDGDGGGDDDSGGGTGGIHDEPQAPNVPLRDVDLEAVAAANSKRFLSSAKNNENSDGGLNNQHEIHAMDESNISTSLISSSSKQSLDSTKPPCKKAKQMRLERRNAKLAAKGIDITMVRKPAANTVKEKTLKDYIAEADDLNNKHKLKLVLVRSAKEILTEEAFNLYRKYQLIVHNDNPQRLTPNSLARFCYKSPLQLILVHVKSKQFKNSVYTTFSLFQKYQECIHNDPQESVEEYLDFLQRSPLKHSKVHDGPATGYGSFHQQYWLDDKLIAVAVIDILPYCVSSVYFFYDPDYSFLSLGTYASLREINLVHELAAKVPALRYYYMGFYIHSCPKMRYKGKLQPSYLLCPETYTWHLLNDDIQTKLSENKYQRFNPDASAKDSDEFLEHHLDGVLLLVDNNTCITYREYIQSFNIESIDNMLDIIRSRIYKEITGEEDDRELIQEYGRLVGKTCAHRMLYLKI